MTVGDRSCRLTKGSSRRSQDTRAGSVQGLGAVPRSWSSGEGHEPLGGRDWGRDVARVATCHAASNKGSIGQTWGQVFSSRLANPGRNPDRSRKRSALLYFWTTVTDRMTIGQEFFDLAEIFS